MKPLILILVALCAVDASAQLSIATGYTSISYKQDELWRHGALAAIQYTKSITSPLDFVASAQYSVYFDSKDYEFVVAGDPIWAKVEPYQVIDIFSSLEYTLPAGPTISIGIGLAYRNSSVQFNSYDRAVGGQVSASKNVNAESYFAPTFRIGCGYRIDLGRNMFLYPEVYLHNSFSHKIVRNPINMKFIIPI